MRFVVPLFVVLLAGQIITNAQSIEKEVGLLGVTHTNTLDNIFLTSLHEISTWLTKLNSTLTDSVQRSVEETETALSGAVKKQTLEWIHRIQTQAQAALDATVRPLLSVAISEHRPSANQPLPLNQRRLHELPLLKTKSISKLLDELRSMSQSMLAVELLAAEQEVLDKVKQGLRYHGIEIPSVSSGSVRQTSEIDADAVNDAVKAAQDAMANALLMSLGDVAQEFHLDEIQGVPHRRLMETKNPLGLDISSWASSLQQQVGSVLHSVNKMLEKPERYVQHAYGRVADAMKGSKNKNIGHASSPSSATVRRSLMSLSRTASLFNRYRTLREQSAKALLATRRHLMDSSEAAFDKWFDDVNANPIENVVFDVMNEKELFEHVVNLLGESSNGGIKGAEAGSVVIALDPRVSALLVQDLVDLTNDMLGILIEPPLEIDFLIPSPEGEDVATESITYDAFEPVMLSRQQPPQEPTVHAARKLLEMDESYEYFDDYTEDWFFNPEENTSEEQALMSVVVQAVAPQRGTLGLPPALLHLLLDENTDASTSQLLSLLATASSQNRPTAQEGDMDKVSTELPSYNVFGVKKPLDKKDVEDASTIVVSVVKHSMIPSRVVAPLATKTAVPHNELGLGFDARWFAIMAAFACVGILLGGFVLTVGAHSGRTYSRVPLEGEHRSAAPAYAAMMQSDVDENRAKDIKTPRKMSNLPA